MSNNKQSMKLYTEFELKFAMDTARCQQDLTFDEVLQQLTPIEIPSDMEIIAKSKQEPDNSDIETAARIGYVAGAKWMRDKIGGDKYKKKMSNNKQSSSVEHFWKQLEEKGNAHIETEGVITVNITIDVNEYRLLQKQAKAMHEVQVRRAFYDGQRYEGTKSSMDYYNETFGGNNED